MFAAACGNTNKQQEKKTGFELKGKLANASGEKLYLEEMSSKGVNVVDTAALDDKGEFAFLHANPVVGFYRVRITDANFAMLVLDSTQKVTLNGDARDLGNNFTVEGSPDSKLFSDMNLFAKASYQKRDSMMRSYEAYANMNKGNKAKIDEFNASAEKEFNAEQKKMNDYLLAVVNKNMSSLVAIVALQQLSPELSDNGYIDLFKQVDAALGKKYKNSVHVQNFHTTVESMSKTLPGSVAPDFSAATPAGGTLALASFKGKIVLLDFWASWCGPCRAENPNMVKMYKAYHSKGLEILSISLDEKKEKWLAAIEKDKLDWSHVSDLGGWQSAIAKMYNVSSIPQTFLLDKDGKIIAKGLRGEDLEAKLKEVFK